MGSKSAMPGAGGEGRLTLKRKEGTFLGDRYVLSLSCGVGGYVTLCICKAQFSKRVHFVVYVIRQ